MTSEVVRAQVVAANRAFYEAFERLDVPAMEAVWDTGRGVACLHPGGPWIHGWDEVRASWEAVMAHTGYIEFAVDVLGVRVIDPVAWVTCVERIRTVGPGGTAEAEVAATNVFVLGADGWRMTVHHGSSVIRPSPA